MLLKTTEKIIRENAFEQKKKKPRLDLNLGYALISLQTTGPIILIWLKHAYLRRSMDVKFIFDSARLGFNFVQLRKYIVQIADVALRVIFLLFLTCFKPFFA